MKQMFDGCLLKKLNLSNFNTDNVTDMSYMFSKCKIREINLFNFNTKNVKDMRFMFNHCESLEELDFPILIQKK